MAHQSKNFGPMTPPGVWDPGLGMVQQAEPAFKEPAESMLDQLKDFEHRLASDTVAVEGHKRGLDAAMRRQGESRAVVKKIKEWLLAHLDEMSPELKDRAVKAGLK